MLDTPATRARARLSTALVATGHQDRAAFRQVYSLTSAKLYGICLRICRDQQAAEDVLSEVYVLVWQRASSYVPGLASPISWLAIIARNRAIDWRRANPLRKQAGVELLANLADGCPSAFDQLEREELVARLRGALASLDALQESAIRAAFFDGITYAELAEREGVPLGTMKSWVRRGLLRLRRELGDSDDQLTVQIVEDTCNSTGSRSSAHLTRLRTLELAEKG